MVLTELSEKLTNSIDNKKTTVGVFIDLKKSFDTIDHKLLLKRLEFYGISQIAVCVFEKYNVRSITNYMWCTSGINTWT